MSVGADIEAARLTAPAYPFKLPIVNAERPCEPALTGTELGFAVMEKSSTVTLTITERDNVALVPVNDPVTATVYTPACPEHDNPDELEPEAVVRIRVPGLSEHVKPEGEADEDRPTVPVNPLTAAT